MMILNNMDVKDPVTMSNVMRDEKSMGEIMLKGNDSMNGYLHDHKSIEEAFEGGWFHKRDVGVVHPNRYMEIKEHSKDVIISGREKISSMEVESLLYMHSLVTKVFVVVTPHPY